tara:strand:+ start:914 stop:1393 length:480 start_codon:yes stop_codon:yes gene_type:complete
LKTCNPFLLFRYNKGKEKEMKKGQLVKLNPNVCFTKEQGGGRRSTLTNIRQDEAGIVEGTRPTTNEEQDNWYKSQRDAIARAKEAGRDPFSIAFDDGGESRLAPQSCWIPLHRDHYFQVLRARARVQVGWNTQGGMTKILCLSTGEECYIKREYLMVVS